MELVETRNRIGFALRQRREQLSLTQEEVVEELDITQAYLSQLENGERNPSLQLLCQAAQLYDISLATLFRNAEV